MPFGREMKKMCVSSEAGEKRKMSLSSERSEGEEKLSVCKELSVSSERTHPKDQKITNYI